MAKIILTTEQELSNALKSVLIEHDKEKEAMQPCKVYTINQVAKILGKAHATVKKLVKNGLIKCTRDGLISEKEINEYLGQQ